MSEDPLSTLELVDDLQRLGISYHFKEEISSVMNKIYMRYFKSNENWNKSNLTLKALGFRLLRQHDYHVPQPREIFKDIKDEIGNIKANIHEDILGMLNLYEASLFAIENEKILDEVREFTSKCLKEKLQNNIGNSSLSMIISHALELPLLWRPPRFETIWFMEAYKRRSNIKPLLLEFAKLDFNIVQRIHQEDLKYLSRWWDDLSWNKKLNFARDRLVESFMWAVGTCSEPSLGVVRKNLTMLISLINVIDDIYDVYGTLDELERFTSIVRRWDINGINELPDYMKICFLGFYNTINEMAYDTLKNQEFHVIPYVRKAGDYYESRSGILKENVRTLISKDTISEDPLSTLELVDDLQRLGISYHFKEEISSVMNKIYMHYFKSNGKWNKSNLTLKALGFRLLRQHDYHVPQPREIFKDIKVEMGNIKANIHEDILGMLNLYEASLFAIENEKILDEVREFTSKCLKEKLQNNIGNPSLLMIISHALELPLLWRPPRFETIWFMEAYKRRSNIKPLLLEFAKLDFNIVQMIHQEDLKYLSRWWEDLSWNKKLNFARDRLVESFMWAVGACSQPSLGVLRKNLTMLISLINVIDDIYDVYGTLDELERFTGMVRRWDINGINELPDYMKICFPGFYNTINEMAYDTLKNQEFHVIPYVRKAWADFCEAGLVEAKWFKSGYIPTLEEYLKNSCVSISLPLIISNLYFFTSNDITGERTLQNVVRYSSMILRLADDLGTSMAELKRGDVPKSIQCYMHETGVSEEKAREHIKNLIMETWKKLNKERLSTNFPSSCQILVECATNLGRMALFTYQYADVFGSPDDWYKSQEISLIFNPIS